MVYKNNSKILICWQSKLQSGEPMDWWIDGSIGLMDGWFDEWIDGLINALIDGSIYWWIDISLDRLIG